MSKQHGFIEFSECMQPARRIIVLRSYRKAAPSITPPLYVVERVQTGVSLWT